MWVWRTNWERLQHELHDAQRDLAAVQISLTELRTKVLLFEATDVARATALREAAKVLDRSAARERMQSARAAERRRAATAEGDDDETIDELLERVRAGERIRPDEDEDEDDG